MSFTEKAKDVAHDVAEKIPDSVKETAGDLKEKAEELIDKVKDRLGLGGDDTEETEVPAAADAPIPDDDIPTANPS